MLEAAERNGLSFPPLAAGDERQGCAKCSASAPRSAIRSTPALRRCPARRPISAASRSCSGSQHRRAHRAGGTAAGAAAQQQGREPARRSTRWSPTARAKPIAIVSMISYMFTEHTKRVPADLQHLPVLQEVDKALKARRPRRTLRRCCARSPRRGQAPSRSTPPMSAAILARRKPPRDGLCAAERGGFQGAAARLRHRVAARSRREQRRRGRARRAGDRLSGRAQAVVRRDLAQVRHRRRHPRHQGRGRAARRLCAARRTTSRARGPAEARAGAGGAAGLGRRRARARRAARSGGRAGADVRRRRRAAGTAQGRELRRGAAAATGRRRR